MSRLAPGRPAALPVGMTRLVAVYTAASLAHFVHNAEFLPYYPNMPAWLTRDTVYLAWLVIAGVGALGLAGLRCRMPGVGVFLLGMYGGLGLDGLAHYTLALCSEHTLATNLTIWSEVITGLVLMLAAALWLVRHLRPVRAPTGMI